MARFSASGKLEFNAEQIARIKDEFLATSVDNDETLTTIRTFFDETGYVLDPHTATGIKAGKALAGGNYPVVCLATAHAAKFPEAVNKAIGKDPERPASLDGLDEKECRCERIKARTEEVRDYLATNALNPEPGKK